MQIYNFHQYLNAFRRLPCPRPLARLADIQADHCHGPMTAASGGLITWVTDKIGEEGAAGNILQRKAIDAAHSECQPIR
ncbi:hypothetical protein [Roseovarius sp. M141]|uniref:hypothetical protein n=1 Tax=Roseovarius sp. M141 TaxID=2583806 RepID=UPI0020CBB503|nr:hypothetical protein [Roseovarius sp. M141]MCQ0092227.1 hypothetical protein [Roseovarius sp. M141]